VVIFITAVTPPRYILFTRLLDKCTSRQRVTSAVQANLNSFFSYRNCAVRVEAWFAMAAAFSSEPPFFRYAVIPVARNV
jgi:hypothetical protein